jgi:hypothetical protein
MSDISSNHIHVRSFHYSFCGHEITLLCSFQMYFIQIPEGIEWESGRLGGEKAEGAPHCFGDRNGLP